MKQKRLNDRKKIDFDFDGNPSNDQLAKGASCILTRYYRNTFAVKYQYIL